MCRGQGRVGAGHRAPARACVVAPRACAVVALLALVLWRCSACFFLLVVAMLRVLPCWRWCCGDPPRAFSACLLLLVLLSLLRVLVAVGSYERGSAGSEVLLGARN